MSRTLTIGSRGSLLALWQANFVANQLKTLAPVEIEIKKIKTTGDKILDAPLAKIGDKGLFVKEIEIALSAGEVDLAVHSSKDLPTELPADLTIEAVLKRQDPRDALISRTGEKLLDLPSGAIIGTSSLRRKAQLLNRRRDFRFVDVRGNLDTRLRKMTEGEFDAIVLASAGLDRMEWSERITERIPEDLCLPAVGQGAIAVEIRAGDKETAALVGQLNHENTFSEIAAERALMKRLEGGCQVPIGALARVSDGHLKLDGVIASLDGSQIYRNQVAGPASQAEELGRKLAEFLLDAGGDKILEKIREAGD